MSNPQAIAATLTLLRRLAAPASLDYPATDFGPGLDWGGVVAFASAQLVLPALFPAIEALGPAVPEAAQEFFLRIHAANAARNVVMHDALLSISGALNRHGIEPIVLKGAALLASRPKQPVAWRFLSDLDLLVSAEGLPQAVAALVEIGYAPREADYDPARDAHYPALIAPSGRFAVELHTRLFAERCLPALEVRLPAAAKLVQRDGVRYRLPTPADRIAHLIVHAQSHHRHFATHRLLMRGFFELSIVLGNVPASETLTAALEPFESHQEQRMAMSYLAAFRRLLAPAADLGDLEASDLAWADTAIAGLGQSPGWRASVAAISLAGREAWRSLGDSAQLQRHLGTLLSPAKLRSRLARHRDRLRQAYWA